MPRASTRWLATVLLLVSLATLAAWVWSRRADSSLGEEVADLPAIPETGSWRYAPSDEEPDRPDQLARVLSLPYLTGSKIASGRTGVTAYARDHAWNGVNLYVSGHAPEAILLSMEGEVLHRWRLDPRAAFGDREPGPGSRYFRRAHLLPEGELLVLLQGDGMVKLDADSNPVWALDLGLYNDLEVGPGGTIYTLGKQARVLPETGREELVLEDAVVVLSPEGEELERISLLRAFYDTPFAELLTPLGPSEDILHSNTVTYLDGTLVHISEIFREGNLLVSFREIDTIAILDPDREQIVWAARGPWVGQHEPVPLANGRILLFDNQGAAGRARVLETDPLTGDLLWEYLGPAVRPLESPEAGSCRRFANGNTLITESDSGRAIEITGEGDIVWEFVSPHRAGEDREFIATLFEVVRLAPELAAFVEEAG